MHHLSRFLPAVPLLLVAVYCLAQLGDRQGWRRFNPLSPLGWVMVLTLAAWVAAIVAVVVLTRAGRP